MKSAILITIAITGLNVLPAKAQVVFGVPQDQNTPVIVVPTVTPQDINYYPYLGSYHYNHYFQSTNQYVNFEQYDYLLSDDLVYDFPVVGNFSYERI